MSYHDDTDTLGCMALVAAFVLGILCFCGVWLAGRHIRHRDTRAAQAAALSDEKAQDLYCEQVASVRRVDGVRQVNPETCIGWAQRNAPNPPSWDEDEVRHDAFERTVKHLMSAETHAAPAAPTPCTKDGPLAGGEAWTCGQPPNRQRVFLPTLGGTAVEVQ